MFQMLAIQNNKTQNMAKTIIIDGHAREIVSVEEARTFFKGRKGEHMARRSFLQMLYRGDIPAEAYTKSTKGNYWFDKIYLIDYGNNKRKTIKGVEVDQGHF